MTGEPHLSGCSNKLHGAPKQNAIREWALGKAEGMRGDPLRKPDDPAYRRGWIRGRLFWGMTDAKTLTGSTPEPRPRIMSEDEAWSILIRILGS